MLYKAGYKYQTVSSVTVHTAIRPEQGIQNQFISLYATGMLVIKSGYAWNGPSGPTFDTLNFMRGSLVHDALYQLMREKLLARKWRLHSDRLLQEICREDGMSRIRAWWVFSAVDRYGDPSSDPANARKVIVAP